MGPTSLKEAFQGMAQTSATLFKGEVIAVSPITIKSETDDKLVLSDTLRIPKHLTAQQFPCNISGGTVSATITGGGYSHSISNFSLTGATITIDNSLKVGDKVYLLAVSENKLYYVLDKAV